MVLFFCEDLMAAIPNLEEIRRDSVDLGERLALLRGRL